MTSNESERISLRAAINERTERLRGFEAGSHMPANERMIYAGIKAQIADLRAQLLENLNAALAERAARLRETEGFFGAPFYMPVGLEIRALKAQIRDLETEKHGLLQEIS